MTTTLKIGTKISRIMNLDFLQHQKMLYSFLKSEHLFLPSIQMNDFASGVDNLVIKSLMSSFTLLRLFFTRFKHFELLSTFLLLPYCL